MRRRSSDRSKSSWQLSSCLFKQQLARLSWDRAKAAQRLYSFGLDTLKQLVRMK
ncbi:hypothetical protein [Nostoc sp.]|uniref:hypothetical protein n=1 Tax=Nostoc sp. TaxID=1180 RepID=UPI002FFD02A6